MRTGRANPRSSPSHGPGYSEDANQRPGLRPCPTRTAQRIEQSRHARDCDNAGARHRARYRCVTAGQSPAEVGILLSAARVPVRPHSGRSAPGGTAAGGSSLAGAVRSRGFLCKPLDANRPGTDHSSDKSQLLGPSHRHCGPSEPDGALNQHAIGLKNSSW